MTDSGVAAGKTVTFMFSDGETLTFGVGDDWTGEEKIVNGGLHDVTLLLANQLASGVVGASAYDALKLGIRFLRLRLSWGAAEDQQRYVEYIARTAVAAKLDRSATTKAVRCVRQTDHWDTVVVAGGHTYRVRAPLNDPEPTAISVDVE